LVLGGVAALAALGVALSPATRAADPKTDAPRDAAAPLEVPTDPAEWRGEIDYRALDTRLAAMMSDPSMTGLAVAVVEDGRLSFVRGYGVASVETGEPVGAHTVFRWASLSKTVAGTLSARLAADGVFDLSDRVGAFPTSLRLPGGAEQALTLEQLLSQQTGLPKNAYDGRLEDGEDAAAIRQSLALAPTVCLPGACHTYQNIAFDAISEVIADRTGEAYGQVVAERLFAPLGMKSASVDATGLTAAPHWARPHRHGTALPFVETYYRVPAAAGVNSDIVDLARWMQALMGLRPDVLPAEVLATAQHARVSTGRPYGRLAIARELQSPGYGLGMRSFTYKGHQLLGHSGGLSGYRATMMFDPATRTGIAMLWNSDANLPFRFQAEFMDRAYGLPFMDWLELKTPPQTVEAAAE
jgi:beta-lactamase class C